MENRKVVCNLKIIRNKNGSRPNAAVRAVYARIHGNLIWERFLGGK